MFQWTKVLIPCLHACFYGISINVALTKNKMSLPEEKKKKNLQIDRKYKDKVFNERFE